MSNTRGPSWRREFKDLILESPMKIAGDAPFETLNGLSKSVRALNDEYKHIVNRGKFEVYEHKTKNLFIVGKFFQDEITDTERFGIIAELSYSPQTFRSTANKILKQRDVVSVDTVHVHGDERQSGIASYLYKILLTKYNVMSDKLQYEKAALMWKNFASETSNTIYIYDANEDKIISKMSSKTPDSHIWSSDTSKMKIRMIMVGN